MFLNELRIQFQDLKGESYNFKDQVEEFYSSHSGASFYARIQFK